jgi:hypothetical protein
MPKINQTLASGSYDMFYSEFRSAISDSDHLVDRLFDWLIVRKPLFLTIQLIDCFASIFEGMSSFNFID